MSAAFVASVVGILGVALTAIGATGIGLAWWMFDQHRAAELDVAVSDTPTSNPAAAGHPAEPLSARDLIRQYVPDFAIWETEMVSSGPPEHLESGEGRA